MKYYLAYGSNLSLEQMAVRCPDALPVGTATLEGYRLAFRGSHSGAYLTIIPEEGAQTPVAVWSVSEADERSLDIYEGFPRFYDKISVQTKLEPLSGGRRRTIEAMVYLLPMRARPGIPTTHYWNVCAEGYARFGFDMKHMRQALEEVEHGRANKISA